MGKPTKKDEAIDAEVIETKEGKIVEAAQNETSVAVANAFDAKNYIAEMDKEEKEFQEVNGHLGIDFVDYIGYIRKDATGKLYDTAGEDPDETLGEHIYIVPGKGESQYALWVPEGSEDLFPGTSLLCRNTEKDEVLKYLNEQKQANTPGFENITEDNINKEYLMLVAFWTEDQVKGIVKGKIPEDVQLRYLNFRSAAFYNWRMYITKIFKGNFSGIKKGTGVSDTLTKMSTVSQKNRNNAKIQFINYEFEPITFDKIKNI